jgi:hypothetical protein
MQDCTSVASAAQIETPTVPVVRVTFGLQMTANEFTKKQQDSFREAIASVLAVNAEQVRILAISEPGAASGRRLTEGIRVMTEVDCGGNAGKGASMVKSLKLSAINAELAKRGLPPAKIREAPKVAHPVPAEPSTEEQNKKSVNVVPIAGGVVGIVAMITAAALFVRWHRRTSRGASDPVWKISQIKPGGSLAQPNTQDDVCLQTQDCQSSDESSLPTPITTPALTGSNTVRLDVLDLEPDEIAVSSTTRPPSRLDLAERPSYPEMHLRTPLKTRTSTRPTAVAVHSFPKEKLAEMIMTDLEQAKQGQSLSSSLALIDTSRCIEVLGADYPGASNSVVEPVMDDRARATAILRKMREEGLLVKTEANLVLLQQNKEEASSGTVGLVASREAGRRMESAETSVSSSTFLEDDQLSTSGSVSSIRNSLPGGVPMPRLNDKPKSAPPPLGAWESSAQMSTSVSLETPASGSECQSMLLSGPKDSHVFGMGDVGAPIDPESPHLVENEMVRQTPKPTMTSAQSPGTVIYDGGKGCLLRNVKGTFIGMSESRKDITIVAETPGTVIHEENAISAAVINTNNTLGLDYSKSVLKGREAIKAMYDASMAAGGSSDESEVDQYEQKNIFAQDAFSHRK